MAHLVGNPHPDLYPAEPLDVLAMTDNREVLDNPDAFRLGTTQLDFLGQLVGTQPVSELNANYLQERGLFGGTPAIHQAVEEALTAHQDAEQLMSLHQGMLRGQRMFDGMVEHGNGPQLRETNAARHRERQGSITGPELVEWQETVRSGAVEAAQGKVVEYMHKPLKKRQKDLRPTREERASALVWEGFVRAEGLDELVREQRMTPAQLAAGPNGLRAAADFARTRAGRRTPLTAQQRLARPARTAVQDQAEQMALLVDLYDRVLQDEVLGPLLERIVARANEINPDDPIALDPPFRTSRVRELEARYEAPGTRDTTFELPAHIGGAALRGRDPRGRAHVLNTPGTPVRTAAERFVEPPVLPPFGGTRRPRPRYTDDIESPFLDVVAEDAERERRRLASVSDLDTDQFPVVIPRPAGAAGETAHSGPEVARGPRFLDAARAQIAYEFSPEPQVHAREILGDLIDHQGVAFPADIARRTGLSVAEINEAFGELQFVSAVSIDPSGEFLLVQQHYRESLDTVDRQYPFAGRGDNDLNLRDFTEPLMQTIRATVWGELPLGVVYRRLTIDNETIRSLPDERSRYLAAMNVIDALVSTRQLQMAPTVSGAVLRQITPSPTV